jgi:hypothetical protein
MGQIDADDNFLYRILFTYEASFHTSGVVYGHNCRILAREPMCHNGACLQQPQVKCVI